MSFLIDTIKLTGSLANIREALIAALRVKGLPVKEDASLCEIVDTINRGAVDYCGFVRCLVGEDAVYFSDKIEVSLDTRSSYHVYENMIVSDVAKLVALELITKNTAWNIVVSDWVTKRKQTKRFFDVGLSELGPLIDLCTYSIEHRITDGKVYFRNVQEYDIIVQDKVTWQIFNTDESELLRSGT
jgi:hypothetical protein